MYYSHPAFTCSDPMMEMSEQYVKSIPSQNIIHQNDITDIVLVSYVNFDKNLTYFSVSIVDFEQVNIGSAGSYSFSNRFTLL